MKQNEQVQKEKSGNTIKLREIWRFFDWLL